MLFKAAARHKWSIIISLGLIILFLFSRLISLTKLPIFVDEAIYLRWAQIAKNDASWRFISLVDGKQPLFVWFTMVMMHFVKDPLVAGRLVSVLAGLGSMAAIWGLSFVLFRSRRLAFLASLLYLAFPFALVYDRMALMDGLVGTFTLLVLLLAVLLVKHLRLDTALLLGAALGGGVLIKTSGFLNIYLLPLTLLLFDWRQKRRFQRLMKWLGLALLAVVISQVFYAILRLSPLFHMISQKDATFVFPFSEWFKHPFLFFEGNLRGLVNWLMSYLTWPWLTLVVFALVSFRKKIWEKLFLFIWFLAPLVALALFGKVLYPRFIFFMSLPLITLAAWGLEAVFKKLKSRWLVGLACLLVFAWSLRLDWQILFQPQKAAIARSDKDQYVRSWPAGYGIKEIVVWAKEEARDQKIFIATEGTFGLMPASLELYLWDYPNVEIKGFFPVNDIPLAVKEKAKKMPTFFVFNETRIVPGSWPLKLIAEYSRPDPKFSMRLYRVVASP